MQIYDTRDKLSHGLDWCLRIYRGASPDVRAIQFDHSESLIDKKIFYCLNERVVDGEAILFVDNIKKNQPRIKEPDWSSRFLCHEYFTISEFEGVDAFSRSIHPSWWSGDFFVVFGVSGFSDDFWERGSKGSTYVFSEIARKVIGKLSDFEIVYYAFENNGDVLFCMKNSLSEIIYQLKKMGLSGPG